MKMTERLKPYVRVTGTGPYKGLYGRVTADLGAGWFNVFFGDKTLALRGAELELRPGPTVTLVCPQAAEHRFHVDSRRGIFELEGVVFYGLGAVNCEWCDAPMVEVEDEQPKV